MSSDESKPRVEIIQRPNTLRAKVGGSADGKPGRIDPAALARAHVHVARMAEAHQAQTRVDLRELQDTYKLVVEQPDKRPEHMRRLFKIADGVMNAGRMFGYDLLSEFANSLSHFIVNLPNPNQAQMQVVALHIDAMHALVRDDIKGDGGALGKALAQSLAMARAKLLGRK